MTGEHKAVRLTIHISLRWWVPLYIEGVCLMAMLTGIEPDADKVPAFFTDLKPANFGLLDGRVVCHDYSLHLLRERALTGHMRKADWHD